MADKTNEQILKIIWYYPDIVILEKNQIIIIEVKSTYTYKQAAKCGILQAKQQGCEKLNYLFKTYIFNNTGEIVKVYEW